MQRSTLWPPFLEQVKHLQKGAFPAKFVVFTLVGIQHVVIYRQAHLGNFALGFCSVDVHVT